MLHPINKLRPTLYLFPFIYGRGLLQELTSSECKKYKLSSFFHVIGTKLPPGLSWCSRLVVCGTLMNKIQDMQGGRFRHVYITILIIFNLLYRYVIRGPVKIVLLVSHIQQKLYFLKYFFGGSDSQFRCAWYAHDILDWRQYEGQSDYHTIVLLETRHPNQSMPIKQLKATEGHFCNKVVETLFKKYHILHNTSIAYHPQTNG